MPSRKGTNPVPVPVPKPQQPKPPPLLPVKPASRWLLVAMGIIAALIAVAFSAVGMFLNYNFCSSLVTGQFAPILLGSLGVSIDASTTFLPSFASTLWEQKRKWQSVCAALLWVPCFVMTTIIAIGFASLNIGDTLQGRDTIVKNSLALNEQLGKAKTNRGAIKEAGDQKIIENQMNIALGSVPMKNRTSSKECTEPTLSAIYCYDYNRFKDAYIAAKARDDLDTQIASLTARIAALPAVSSKDPLADIVQKITGGAISQDQTELWRNIGFAMLCAVAPGMLMWFARTLLR